MCRQEDRCLVRTTVTLNFNYYMFMSYRKGLMALCVAVLCSPGLYAQSASSGRLLSVDEMFRLACWNTFCFLLAGLPLILLVSYLIALLLKKQAQKHMLLKSVLLFPYIMPIVGTVLLTELLFDEVGVVNRILLLMGVPIEKWLESSWAFWIVVGLYLWKNAGYSVVLLLAGLMTIPEEVVSRTICGSCRFLFWEWRVVLGKITCALVK